LEKISFHSVWSQSTYPWTYLMPHRSIFSLEHFLTSANANAVGMSFLDEITRYYCPLCFRLRYEKDLHLFQLVITISFVTWSLKSVGCFELNIDMYVSNITNTTLYVWQMNTKRKGNNQNITASMVLLHIRKSIRHRKMHTTGQNEQLQLIIGQYINSNAAKPYNLFDKQSKLTSINLEVP
jgi:hypothetical protein